MFLLVIVRAMVRHFVPIVMLDVVIFVVIMVSYLVFVTHVMVG
jgi:hypothetical protein